MELAEWSRRLGPSIAVEIEPIKDWLELEAGFTPLISKGSSPEWSTDILSSNLFKKPLTLSNTMEFMIGAGAEWIYTDRGRKIAAEFALDFMFWPWPERKLG